MMRNRERSAHFVRHRTGCTASVAQKAIVAHCPLRDVPAKLSRERSEQRTTLFRRGTLRITEHPVWRHTDDTSQAKRRHQLFDGLALASLGTLKSDRAGAQRQHEGGLRPASVGISVRNRA